MKMLMRVFLLTGLSIVYQAGPVHSAGIALVTGINGEATVKRDPTPQNPRLKFKDDLFWRDTLSTGTDSRLRILLLQKSVVTMRELSQLQLREELASPAQPKNKSVVNLISGATRVVVEKDALKNTDYEVHTNMAVAAIRGSDVFAQTIAQTGGGSDVEICTGPGSTATATHNDPAVGQREMPPLTCGIFFPNGWEWRQIPPLEYLRRVDFPFGPQHRGSPDYVPRHNPGVELPPLNVDLLRHPNRIPRIGPPIPG